MTSPFALALALFVMAVPLSAGAQTIETTPNGRYEFLRSDLFVRVPDWPMLRRQVLTGWGVVSVEEVPLEDLGRIGEDDDRLLVARSEGLEILSLMTPPEDLDILYKLAALFEDISAADIDLFGDALVLEASEPVGTEVEITAYFLRSVAPPADPPVPDLPPEQAEAIEATMQSLQAAMPAGSELAEEQRMENGGRSLRYIVLEPRPTLLDILRDALALIGLFQFIEGVDGDGFIALSLLVAVDVLISGRDDGGQTVLIFVQPN